ncbi:MAG: metallophosphoesterase family protein [Clostridia bacterium]|nr:metallophosphoesterase family protein [Clostridia bacterium]
MKKLVLILMISTMIFLSTGCQNGLTIVTYAESKSFNGTVIFGRPTYTSIAASITTYAENDVFVAYGENSGVYTSKTEIKSSNYKTPAEFILNGLEANKKYYYVIYFKGSHESNYSKSEEYSFSTPKLSGNSFNFVIQADSHLLNKADSDLYFKSMQTIAAFNPDFMFDLGDTFLMDNGGNDINVLTQEDVNEIYRQQLQYFDMVTRNAPLFLAIGNHESEYGVLLDGTRDNIAAKSTIARTTYYLNPFPDQFYSGNLEKEDLIGSPENYYAFTWGDALFVSIDPYRYSENGASEDLKGDGWGWSLGKTQYDWFRDTLESSHAKYKFVFAHHAIGNIRGGANIAELYEWGGYDQKGNYLFDEKRPGWGKPIQEVMKDTGVTIFFQGHDHVFAREDVDGIVYQTLPKPAERIADNQLNAKYFTGDVLLNSGFLNVSVDESGVQVDYNRNYLVASGDQTTGVVYSYRVDSDHHVTVLKKTEDILNSYGKNDESLNKTEKSKISSDNIKNKSIDIVTPSIGVGAISAMDMNEIPASGFSFTIEADSHFDENYQDELLQMTANNILKSNPHFLIDLGDTSMLEKLGKSPEKAIIRNNLVALYFSKFGTLPIKMVTGNHDVPINNGNPNYYSFTKNNALFIILDPYAFSEQSVSRGGGWATTLGKIQYEWLNNTLSNSSEDFKFVFIHNLTGGISKDSRGGAEAAEFFEWGGNSEAGIDEFSEMRPGWDMPIHDLLLKYGVDVVFHGHDHFYAKQDLNGLIYQLVPQPGTPGNSVNDATTYGYKNGVLLPSAGFLRVVVSSENTIIEYIKTSENGNFTIPNVYSIPVNNNATKE